MSANLTEYDFCVLRFKIAKLLKVTHRRVKTIDVMEDGKIIAHTSLGFFPVEFNSIKEINDDFTKFYQHDRLAYLLSLRLLMDYTVLSKMK